MTSLFQTSEWRARLDILNIFLIFVLILISGFFVASEFAVVKVRKSRIDQLANEGNKQALAARSVLSNLDVYLSACQLGITITSLGLGWLCEPTVEHILRPLFEKINITEKFIMDKNDNTIDERNYERTIKKTFASLIVKQVLTKLYSEK